MRRQCLREPHIDGPSRSGNERLTLPNPNEEVQSNRQDHNQGDRHGRATVSEQDVFGLRVPDWLSH